jgi:hypothetical protein
VQLAPCLICHSVTVSVTVGVVGLCPSSPLLPPPPPPGLHQLKPVVINHWLLPPVLLDWDALWGAVICHILVATAVIVIIVAVAGPRRPWLRLAQHIAVGVQLCVRGGGGQGSG